MLTPPFVRAVLALCALLGLSQLGCSGAAGLGTPASVTTAEEMPGTDAALHVRIVDGPPTGDRVVLSQLRRDETGPTSMRYYAPRTGPPTKTDDWVYHKGADNGGTPAAYYYRDRDLGQTFQTGPEGFRIGAITVRVQPVDVAGADPAGARVSVQLLRVSGPPRVNPNGTTAYAGDSLVAQTSPNGVSMWNGDGPYRGLCTNALWSTYATDWPHDPADVNNPYRWPSMHYSDDFLEGETYQHVALATGGVVPDSLGPDDYMRWEIDGGEAWDLEPNAIYAFLLLFDEPAAPGVNRNIPLSNINILPGGSLSDPFPAGHMIRRDGATTVLDEVFIRDTNDGADLEASRLSASFPVDALGTPDAQARLAIPPGTLGYPDVDTYRDLWFVIERK